MSKQYEKDELGVRMKTYEKVTRNFLTIGAPHIIRLDMRAGSSFCKNFKKPFDDIFSKAMIRTAIALCEQIPGVKFAYTQSDEISLAINDDFGNVEYQCFFDGNVQKIVSISASIATLEFNKAYIEIVNDAYGEEFTSDERILDLNPHIKNYRSKFFKAQFDSRVFSLPNTTEVYNYFLWRQQDATRNSILSVGYANLSQKEMENKNCSQILGMLRDIDINWYDLPIKYKKGTLIVRRAFEKEATWTNKNGEVETKRCIRHKWTDNVEMPVLSSQHPYSRDAMLREFDRQGSIFE